MLTPDQLYTNTGINRFQCAIGKIPFNYHQDESNNNQYATADIRVQQIDTSAAPGEQSLGEVWWKRSQSSWHLGMGVDFLNIQADPNLQYRFRDSHGIDSITKTNQLTLLHKTTRVAGTSAFNTKVIGYNIGGTDGLLWSHGEFVTAVTANVSGSLSVTQNTVNMGNNGVVKDLEQDGGRYFGLATDGLFGGSLPNGNGTKFFNLSCDTGNIGYVKGRLIAGIDNKLYELIPDKNNANRALPTAAPSSPTAAGSLLLTQPQDNWQWTGVAQGPAKIYVIGYAGDQGRAYAIGLNDDATKTLQIPVECASFEDGEVPLSIRVVANTYVFIGTNLGLRVFYIDGNGGLEVGYLVVDSDEPVYAITAYKNFVYCSGALSGDGKYKGLYKLNVRTILDNSNSLSFAYAKDIYANNVANDDRFISFAAKLGYSNLTAFAVSKDGLYIEEPTALVSKGYLDTPQITYDVDKLKLYEYLDVSAAAQVNGGIITMTQLDRGNNPVGTTPVVSFNTANVDTYHGYASNGTPATNIAYRITLTQGSTTTGPIFRSYTVNGIPVQFAEELITLALNINPREQSPDNPGKLISRATADILKSIRKMYFERQPIAFQSFDQLETREVLIEKFQFVQHLQKTTDPTFRLNPSGILTIQLRTIDGASYWPGQ